MKRSNIESFRVTWEADDGYCGGGRPHHLSVDVGDFDKDDSLESIKEQILDMVEEDFRQTVGVFSENYKDVAQQIFDKLQSEKDTENEEAGEK